MASTVKDAALSLRETVSCADIVATMTAVTLRKNGAELCGACPKCGGDDRFYVTQDNACACRQCHTQRMDSVGLVAWLQNVTMHEAVDILSGHRRYDELPAPPATPKTRRTDEENAYNGTWRSKVAGEAQDRHYRLQADATGAASARSYLLSRGLAPDTWQAFTVGYQEKTHVTGTQRTAPAISWPVCTQDGSTYGVKYRFLEAQDTGADKPLRYTMRKGSRITVDTGAMFGAQLLYADATRRYRALVFCEGEINAMSIWQACNVAGVDVLSFGSEAQTELPPWAIDYASGYGCAIVWLDAEDKSAKVAGQLRHLPHVARLRSPLREIKADANACLVDGRLGALVQAARFHILPPAQHEGVVWQIWDVRHLLDEGQVKVAQKVARRIGVSW